MQSNIQANSLHIGNSQHRGVDVQFGKDDNRARKDHSPENLALIRRVVVIFLTHRDPSSKDSECPRKLRAWLSDR